MFAKKAQSKEGIKELRKINVLVCHSEALQQSRGATGVPPVAYYYPLVCHRESRASRDVTIPSGIAPIKVKALIEAIPFGIVTSLRSSQ